MNWSLLNKKQQTCLHLHYRDQQCFCGNTLLLYCRLNQSRN